MKVTPFHIEYFAAAFSGRLARLDYGLIEPETFANVAEGLADPKGGDSELEDINGIHECIEHALEALFFEMSKDDTHCPFHSASSPSPKSSD